MHLKDICPINCSFNPQLLLLDDCCWEGRGVVGFLNCKFIQDKDPLPIHHQMLLEHLTTLGLDEYLSIWVLVLLFILSAAVRQLAMYGSHVWVVPLGIFWPPPKILNQESLYVGYGTLFALRCECLICSELQPEPRWNNLSPEQDPISPCNNIAQWLLQHPLHGSPNLNLSFFSCFPCIAGMIHDLILGALPPSSESCPPKARSWCPIRSPHGICPSLSMLPSQQHQGHSPLGSPPRVPSVVTLVTFWQEQQALHFR